MESKIILLGTSKENKIVFADLIRAVSLLTTHKWEIPELDEAIAQGFTTGQLALAIPRKHLGCDIPIMTPHGILMCVPHDLKVEDGCLLMQKTMEEPGNATN